MITKDMKVSRVLNEYPETLDVFIKASPHFSKLKVKILRKALAGRVTVDQAASIAGVSLYSLLFELNKSINNLTEPIITISENMNNEKSVQQKPELIANISRDKIRQLDVRPTIESGTDPFQIIMAAVKELQDDEMLLIINSFEPIPLYSVLGKKGFEHWTEKEGDLFKIYFYKNSEAVSDENSLPSKKSSQNIEYEKVIELNVRELVPPEPMMKILETLSQVDDNTLLLVHHHREPMMLYPKLEERGYEAVSNKIEENYYKVVITKKRNA
ncbi:MAG: DUF2249 domain-containing protein [Ignavibacteriaceae bacterium]|nr:DUF2249 domain-containing protein [Ignavibacteriaceae bacterium]